MVPLPPASAVVAEVEPLLVLPVELLDVGAEVALDATGWPLVDGEDADLELLPHAVSDKVIAKTTVATDASRPVVVRAHDNFPYPPSRSLSYQQ